VGRKKTFGILAATNAQRSISQAAIQLAGGIAHVGPVGLIVGQLFSQWGGTVRVARKLWRADSDKFRSVTLHTIAAVGRRFRRFPILTLPQSLLNAIDNNVALLLFAHFFGATVTGYFALGNRLVSIPFALIGNSAQRVFYPAATAAQVNGTLARETADTYAHLLRLVLPIVLVMTACAPELFAVLMGAQWREAGVYMQWLSLRACFTMLVFPLVPLLFVLERHGVGTLFSGAQLVVRIGAVVVGGRLDDARLTVALLGVGTGLQWLAYLFYLLKISGNRVIDAIGRLLFEAMIAAAIASPIVAAKLLLASDLTVTIIAGFSAVIAAATFLWRTSRSAAQTPGAG
jgi:O-antigen/teichoic acid export membrane protein